MIDTGRLDPTKPIDLAAIANTKVFPINTDNNHFGVNLIEEVLFILLHLFPTFNQQLTVFFPHKGMDCFQAKVNLEVQWASEQSIAAVERMGGTITTAYFDIFSVKALANPKLFFQKGNPIPKRLTPPADCIGFYMSAANRGYLADPRKIAEERLVLAQKYGYDLPNIDKDPDSAMLKTTKDPRQVFYNLEPGWVVSLKEKVIYKPVDEELEQYYRNDWISVICREKILSSFDILVVVWSQ